MNVKIFWVLIEVALLIGLQNCTKDPEVSIISNDFDFKVTNLIVDNDELWASGDSRNTINVSWKVIITANGETNTYSGSCKSDELPVRAGDEVEILFTPSCPENTEAFFTLPDGTTHKATASAPSFKWTVPADFTPGMKIEGETNYKVEHTTYTKKGAVTLIDLK